MSVRRVLKRDPYRGVTTWWDVDSNGQVTITNEYDEAGTHAVLDENVAVRNHRTHNPMAQGRHVARVPAYLDEMWRREYAAIVPKPDIDINTWCLIKASQRDFSKCKTTDGTGYERAGGRWSLKV